MYSMEKISWRWTNFAVISASLIFNTPLKTISWSSYVVGVFCISPDPSWVCASMLQISPSSTSNFVRFPKFPNRQTSRIRCHRIWMFRRSIAYQSRYSLTIANWTPCNTKIQRYFPISLPLLSTVKLEIISPQNIYYDYDAEISDIIT